ncbi:MAG: CIA30 family protein [Cyanobacteria bacterium P01_G01_bin.19]
MASWEFGRLWQTLTYFDVIPFLSCWQKIFKPNQAKNIKQNSNMVILVVGATEDLGKILVRQLLQNDYEVRALVDDVSQARNMLDNRVNLWSGDMSRAETLEPDLIKGTDSILCCTQKDIKNLVRVAAQYLNPATNKLIFGFANPNAQIKETWGVVDDVVMGGVSKSNIRLADNKAIFSGIVSTDNNGGFASVRTRNFTTPLDLSDYEGIELKVIGDGKRYKFIARCEGKWDGISYCYSFDTVYNFPTTVRIPFTELIPVFRAKTVTEASSFDASKIYSMQLMLSKFEYDGELNPKFEAGSFALHVESIQAYGGFPQPQFIRVVLPQADETKDALEARIAQEESILRDSALAYLIIRSSVAEKQLENESAIGEFCLKAIANPEAVHRTFNLPDLA